MAGKRHDRAYGLFITAIVMALMIGACGPAAVATPEATEAIEVAPAETEPAAPPAESTYTVKIVVWPGPESDAAQVMVDFFNENRAAEAGFNVELVLFGRDQLFAKQDAIMAASSDEVDTYFLTSPTVARYLQFLEPLDSYYADPNVNIWGATTEDLMQGAVDAYRIDGQLYGIPSDVAGHFLYYRSDYIDELLSNPDWQATYRDICQAQTGEARDPVEPEDWTWEDYVCASYFFTRQYNPDSPTQFGNYTQGKAMGTTSFIWTNALWTYGGDWFGEDGMPVFDSEAARLAQELWTLNFEKGLTPPGSITGEYSEANEALKTGECALGIQWNAAFNELNAQDSPVQGKIAVTATPAGPSGRFTYSQSIGYGLNKFSSHKEQAAAWLIWCSTEEANKVYAEAGGVPAFSSILNGMADQNPMFGALSAVLGEYGRAVQPMAGYYQDIVIENLANAWAGAVSVEESLEVLQEEAVAEKENRGL
jgi:multiple sugar transport system substrate-binding protein